MLKNAKIKLTQSFPNLQYYTIYRKSSFSKVLHVTLVAHVTLAGGLGQNSVRQVRTLVILSCQYLIIPTLRLLLSKAQGHKDFWKNI